MSTVRLPEVGRGDLLPLPHLGWPDGGELASAARALLVRFAERKDEEVPVRLSDLVRDHARFVSETFSWLAEAPIVTRARLTEWTERMYTALDRHAEHREDPFAAVPDAADPPDRVLGEHLPAWPLLIGHLVHRAELDLGRPPRGRARVRPATWGVLVGLAYAWSRASFAAARPGLSAFLGRGGLGHDGLMAGGALLVNQRAVVQGYRDARRGRRVR